MGHGSQSFRGNAATASRAPPRGPADPARFPGFTYLFGPPKPDQRAAIGANIATARPLLNALVALLPESATAGDSAIPSGYTYLLQMLAHDVVQTTVPFWAAVGAGIPARNVRGPGLLLDTLYGGGPTTCPIAFEPTEMISGADDLTKLRLGRVLPAIPAMTPGGRCGFRDLARTNVFTGFARDLDIVNSDMAFQVCVADARNDDNPFLSQLVVLFSIVHNAVVDKLTQASPTLTPFQLFTYARAAVLRMYYNILTHDLLPRILDNRIWPRIATLPGGTGWQWHGHGIPLEFSHGAFRFGHAMIRNQYVLSARRPLPLTVEKAVRTDNRAPMLNAFRNPMPQDWVVEWAQFFSFQKDPDVPAAPAPNFARKIAPHASSIDLGSLFKQDDPVAPPGVTQRDALSGALAQMWTLDALALKIREECNDLIPDDWAFGDPDPAKDNAVRTAEIGKWLNERIAAARASGDPAKLAAASLVEANIDPLCRDLPLSLFVLLEASKSTNDTLGPLGSIIIGAVVGQLLVAGEAELAETIDEAAAAYGGTSWAEQIESVTNMPALIKFAARAGIGVDCPEMPFITR